MDHEETRQPSERVPFTHLEQGNSDFVLAMLLQEQERAYTMLETIVSETEEESSDSSYVSNDDMNDRINDEDFEFFQNQGFEEEREFLENEDMDQDDGLDVDELSYEELIALGEIIGVEKKGLSLNEVSSCLQSYVYKTMENKTGTDRCVVCQIEFEDGEDLVAIEPCEHPYHAECISKWLQVKKCCPICSTEVSSSQP